MTRYYEVKAQLLEAQANLSDDPAEQGRLWSEAAAVGTVVELDDYGHEIWPQGADACAECLAERAGQRRPG